MIKIIIDTDPGQDDALAILLALKMKELIQILGITCVSGNVSVDKTSINARKICELAQRPDIKVFKGCDKPLVREVVSASDIHGKCGMEGSCLPEPTKCIEHNQHAVDWLFNTFEQASEPTILCCLAPLTNIAQLVKKCDKTNSNNVLSKISKIIMMGGNYFERGNITPNAEFNVFGDPDAFDIVLKSGIEIVILPLDVTHKALMTKEWLNELSRKTGNVSKTCYRMLTSYERKSLNENAELNGGPVHDPMVIAYLLAPEIFEGKKVSVEVETKSELTLGTCVVDWHDKYDRKKNVLWINKVDPNAFFELLSKIFD